MRKLLTIGLLFTVVLAKAQTYSNVGNSLQRAPTGKGYFYRFNLGTPGFMYLYTQSQVDSLLSLVNPIGHYLPINNPTFTHTLKGPRAVFGSYATSLDTSRQFIITPSTALNSTSFAYFDALKANKFYVGTSFGDTVSRATNTGWYFDGSFVPGFASGRNLRRAVITYDGTYAGTSIDQQMLQVGNFNGSTSNSLQLTKGGMYLTSDFIADTTRFNPATNTNYLKATTDGSLFATTIYQNGSQVWDKGHLDTTHFINNRISTLQTLNSKLNIVEGGHSLNINGIGISSNTFGNAITFNAQNLDYYSVQHSFFSQDGTLKLLTLGSGTDGPLSYAAHLRVYQKPALPEDVENKRSVDSLLTTKADTGRNYIIFFLGGQSNALPHGDSATSVKITNIMGLKYQNTVLATANDPVGDTDGVITANQGSMWPAFCRSYYNATGLTVILVNRARGGASMAYAAQNGTGGGTWDVGGTLRDPAVAGVDSLFTYMNANHMSYRFGGTIWVQGEQDARAIDQGTITLATYKTALINWMAFLRSHFTPQMPFYIVRLGTRTVDGDTDVPGYSGVRSVEEQVCLTDSTGINFNNFIVNRDALDFALTGHMNADGSHYDQYGYNLIGTNMAPIIANNSRDYAIIKSDAITGLPIISSGYNNAFGLTIWNHGRTTKFGQYAQLLLSNDTVSTSNLNNTLRLLQTGPLYTGGAGANVGQLTIGSTMTAMEYITKSSTSYHQFQVNSFEKARIDANGVHISNSGASPTTNIFDVSGSTNGPVRSLFYNSNTGTATISEIATGQSTSQNDALRLFATGATFTTSGANVQDGSTIEAGSNLSGGLSLVSRASGATMRIYTGGNASGNLIGTFSSTGLNLTGLTASLPVFTDASKNLVNNSITGTGSVVMSASGALTGTPTAPTASAATNTTQIATTAYVKSQGYGTGTVTSVATGYGLSGGSITSTGTLTADTTSSTGVVSKTRLSTNLGGYVPIATNSNITGFKNFSLGLSMSGGGTSSGSTTTLGLNYFNNSGVGEFEIVPGSTYNSGSNGFSFLFGTTTRRKYNTPDKDGTIALTSDVPLILATITGINAKTTASTVIYTVPAGKRLVIKDNDLICTAASAITIGPVYTLTASSSGTIIGTQTTGMTAANQVYLFPITGLTTTVGAGETVSINITGSTGTSQVVTDVLTGYLE